MSSLVIARKSFRDNRTAAFGVGVAVMTMGLLAMALYPTYKESLADFELPAAYQGIVGETGDISSPEGFLSAEFFSWIPLLVITMAIIGGTRALASEESDGTMDILLAQPVSRTRIVLEKAAGLTIAVSVMVFVSIPALLLGKMLVDSEIDGSKLVAAVFPMLSVVLLFTALSLWTAAALPSRSAAVTATAGILVFSFVFHSMGASIDALATARKFFPFYWADSSAVLVHGMRWGWFLWTMAVAGTCLAGAVWSFERRDIASGASDWSLRGLLLGKLGSGGRADFDSEPMEEPGA